MTRLPPRLPLPHSDGELLAAFLTDRDESAFAELVRRHGPAVWGVCRRGLPHAADAEDAFQAVFLVLVRRAGHLTGHPTVGAWLHRVATVTARDLRRKNARRLARTSPLPVDVPVPPPVPVPDVDAALLSLPAKYRTPVVLCHLEGLTQREAAARLGCRESTLSSHVSRGLAKLRAKLSRDPLSLLTVATLPAGLASATARAAAAFAAASAVPSATISHLLEGAMRMFWVKKATTAGVAGLLVLAAGFGLGVGVRHAPATADERPSPLGGPPPADPVADATAAHAKAELAVKRAQEELKAAAARLERAKLDRATQAADPAGSQVVRISIDVNGTSRADKRTPFGVWEHGADGQPQVIASVFNAAALRRHIAQVRVKPDGPIDITVHVDAGATADDVREAVEALTAAGYVGGQIRLAKGAKVRLSRPWRYSLRDDLYTFPRLADAVIEPKPDAGPPVAFRVTLGSETLMYDNRWRLASARASGPAVRAGEVDRYGSTITLTAAAVGTARVHRLDKDGKEHEFEVAVE